MKNLFYRFVYNLAKLYWCIFKPKTQGARTVILAENKVLLIKHIYYGSWVFPGGGIKGGEEPIEAGIREVKEEVGIVLEKPILVGSFVNNNEGKIDTVFVFYKILDKIPVVVLDKKESTEYKWFDIGEEIPLGSVNTKIWEMVKEKVKI